MPLSYGELIRQIRRQYNLTQTELGGEHFSKSYVSAVERNKIAPSSQALQYFAEQLGKPNDYFSDLLPQGEEMKQLAVSGPAGLESAGQQRIQGEGAALLDILLEDSDLSSVTARHQLRALSTEVVALLPAAKQARYHLLMGLMEQEDDDLGAALQAFERALGLAPEQLQAAILNELGLNYYLSRDYHTALSYHQRALRLWEQQNEHLNGTSDLLRFKIEFNCGNDYQALGGYRQALEHYEWARRMLSPSHDMKTAASLYRGLGYCVYGAIDQLDGTDGANPGSVPLQEMERKYQRANGYLLQSRTLYQVGGDWLAAVQARLMQATVLLSFCQRRRQMAVSAATPMALALSSCVSLLNEAEEQCRQSLLTVREMGSDGQIASRSLDAIIYLALAYLIRIFVQQAALARLGGSVATAMRERMVASYLCQEVLSAFSTSGLPWMLIDRAITVKLDADIQQSVSLVRLSEFMPAEEERFHSPLCQAEVYFAVGELTGELAYNPGEHVDTGEWHEQTNMWMQAALRDVKLVVESGERDPGYFAHSYRRGFTVLEERLIAFPDLCEETTKTLVTLLKEGINQLPYTMLPVNP